MTAPVFRFTAHYWQIPRGGAALTSLPQRRQATALAVTAAEAKTKLLAALDDPRRDVDYGVTILGFDEVAT